MRPLSYRNQGTDERGIITDGWDVPGYGRRQEIGLDTVYDFENRNENKVRFGVNYFDESMLTRFADGGMQMAGCTCRSRRMTGAASTVMRRTRS